MCFRDTPRTLAFRKAIRAVVRTGDVVLDAGAGSGVLGFFAVEAGARHVYAVEIDPVQSDNLVASVKANGLEDIVSVVSGDVREVPLPIIDVVIAELIETGLIDELLVPAMNSLHRRHLLASHARTIPYGYKTYMQLVNVDDQAYGFRFQLHRHEWPFYSRSTDDWSPVYISNVGESYVAWEGRFDQAPVNEEVSFILRLVSDLPVTVNGLRVSGSVDLTPSVSVGAFNSMNGDKVVPVPPRQLNGRAELKVSYCMGAGLGSLSTSWIR
jgi:predicted RNA methylase